jgi:ABC-2 type transport system ATP-binding protein
VALALALGRRPAVLLLDEPLASLDPLARTEVMQTLMAEVVDTGLTVVLSSHVIADIEDVCEHLLLLAGGLLRLDGRVEELLAEHSILTGPAAGSGEWPAAEAIVEIRRAERQTTILARGPGDLPAGWTKEEPRLPELILAYLRADQSITSSTEMGSVA